jgi:predicted enzyme related to lactoylglutathione lyase
MTNRLGYFTLDTPDIDKARAFYGALFGWQFDEASSKPTYAHVNGNGLHPAFGFVKGEGKSFANLYFQVADIDAACARVVELGGKAAVPADTESGRSVAVCDDQGVSFSLWQAAPGFD